jgi:hypothetical protein
LRTLATPEPIKDWSLTSLKEKLIKIGAKVVNHGRYVAFQMAEVAIPRQMFQKILRLIVETAAAVTTSASVTCSMGLRLKEQPTGRVCPNARENGLISHSTTVPAAQGDGSRQRRPPVLPKRRKSAKIYAGSRVIRGVPVNIEDNS